MDHRRGNFGQLCSSIAERCMNLYIPIGCSFETVLADLSTVGSIRQRCVAMVLADC
jgi:hypothetical protein